MTLDEDLYALWKAQAVGLASMLLVHALLWVPLMSEWWWHAFAYLGMWRVASVAIRIVWMWMWKDYIG